MTLVAAYKSQGGVPLLIGDFLLSTKAGPIEERRKKIHRLNANLAVGWTGPLWFAKKVVGELNQLFNTATCSYDQLSEFLRRYPVPSLGSDSFALVGWLCDVPMKKGYCFRWRTANPHALDAGSPQLDGSGAETMRSILNDRRDPVSLSSDVYTQAAAEALYDLATLQMDELVGKSYQKQERFGFAYEILVNSNGRFEYLDDVFFVGIDINYDIKSEKAELTIPLEGIKYRNFDTFSVVHVRALGGRSKNYLCAPVYEDVPGWEQRIVPPGSSLHEVLRLRSRFYCAYWRLTASDGLSKQGAYVCTASAPNPGIYITEINGQEHLAIRPGFAKDLYEAARRHKRN
jgi:hypothetical protein